MAPAWRASLSASFNIFNDFAMSPASRAAHAQVEEAGDFVPPLLAFGHIYPGVVWADGALGPPEKPSFDGRVLDDPVAAGAFRRPCPPDGSSPVPPG